MTFSYLVFHTLRQEARSNVLSILSLVDSDGKTTGCRPMPRLGFDRVISDVMQQHFRSGDVFAFALCSFRQRRVMDGKQ